MMNLTVPRHFDRREWGSIFDRLMNQDQLESPLDDLENIKNYIKEEYETLSKSTKDGFRLKYNDYILSK